MTEPLGTPGGLLIDAPVDPDTPCVVAFDRPVVVSAVIYGFSMQAPKSGTHLILEIGGVERIHFPVARTEAGFSLLPPTPWSLGRGQETVVFTLEAGGGMSKGTLSVYAFPFTTPGFVP